MDNVERTPSGRPPAPGKTSIYTIPIEGGARCAADFRPENAVSGCARGCRPTRAARPGRFATLRRPPRRDAPETRRCAQDRDPEGARQKSVDQDTTDEARD